MDNVDNFVSKCYKASFMSALSFSPTLSVLFSHLVSNEDAD